MTSSSRKPAKKKYIYLLLATDGNKAVMEKVEDILTDVLCKAAGAVEISLHPRTEKKS